MLLAIGSSIKDESDNIYILDEIIGQGGFGYVFKAHRKNDKSVFAVKTMLPSFSNNSTAEAFKNEIESAIKISGDNIIRYEYIHSGNTFPGLPPYIIMEYRQPRNGQFSLDIRFTGDARRNIRNT